jgi:hypothetical protein
MYHNYQSISCISAGRSSELLGHGFPHHSLFDNVMGRQGLGTADFGKMPSFTTGTTRWQGKKQDEGTVHHN